MTTKRKARGAEEGNGGEVWDLAKVAQEKAKAARAFLRLMDMPGLPGVLSDNLYSMLNHAATVCDVPIGSEPPHGGYCAKQVAVLFAVSELQRSLTFEPARDFAEMLSATLRHPECPAEIYNAVGECDCMTPDRWDTPEHIRLALASYKAERGAEGKGASDEGER